MLIWRNGSRPTLTCSRIAATSPRPRSRNDQNKVPLKSCVSAIHRRQIARHQESIARRRCSGVGRWEIHPPRHHPQMLIFRAGGAAPGERAALSDLVGGIEFPGRTASAKSARRLWPARLDLVIETGIDPVELVIDETVLPASRRHRDRARRRRSSRPCRSASAASKLFCAAMRKALDSTTPPTASPSMVHIAAAAIRREDRESSLGRRAAQFGIFQANSQARAPSESGPHPVSCAGGR